MDKLGVQDFRSAWSWST